MYTETLALTNRTVVYFRSRLSTELYLSGSGNRELFGDVIRPDPIPDAQPLTVDGLLSIWLIWSNFGKQGPQLQEKDAWGFPFHESCWELIALIRPNDPVDVQALFNVLPFFPVQDGFVNFRHDYGGDAHYKGLRGPSQLAKSHGQCMVLPRASDFRPP